MTKSKFLIVGAGGREAIFAKKLQEETQLFAIISHENPTIIDCVEASGGAYRIGDANSPDEVLAFAKETQIDYAFVSADQPLANGVVDILLEHNIKAVGGSKAATRIEWDKIFSIEVMNKVAPEYTPFYSVVTNEKEIDAALEEFEQKNFEIVVKPQGLTGGKGVKVMPEHLDSFEEAKEYALRLLEKYPQEKVLLVEKVKGLEFTVMGITDGENLVLSPCCYDYPFRLEDDAGPGTGGMGCFTDKQLNLPFMNNDDVETCRDILQRVILEMKAKNLHFNGILNGGFFKTEKGIVFMEYNSRFGDPEALNVLSVLKSSFAEMIQAMYHKTLDKHQVEFEEKVSVIKYLVAPEYPDPSSEAMDFEVDEESIKNLGVEIIYASCIRLGEGKFSTLKKSRVLALETKQDDFERASVLINHCIEYYVKSGLEFRQDIASDKSLKKLRLSWF